MPASGRDFDKRLLKISVVTCTVSPSNRGAGEFHFGHPQIGDRGAKRKIVHGNPDHQTKGEERIDQRVVPIRFPSRNNGRRYGAAAD